jgi:hypothetical protein
VTFKEGLLVEALVELKRFQANESFSFTAFKAKPAAPETIGAK